LLNQALDGHFRFTSRIELCSQFHDVTFKPAWLDGTTAQIACGAMPRAARSAERLEVQIATATLMDQRRRRI
jgi:hypothetical protein